MRRVLAAGVGIAALCAVVAALSAQDRTPADDLILRAMRDELDRSKALRVASLDPVYFIQYTLEDADVLSINATLGALLGSQHTPVRIPTVKVRVGTYDFDNTNHIYSGYGGGVRFDPAQVPAGADYRSIRQVFWLATDRAFKAAEESIGRKRSSLKNVNLTSQLPDFSKAPTVQWLQPVHHRPLDESQWKPLVVKLSGIFNSYPQILASDLEFQAEQSSTYLVNSEGTAIRMPEDLAYLRVRAEAQAPDGMALRDADVFESYEPDNFPHEPELRRGITQMAEELTALARAPVGEDYDGPVLFEPRAAAQLFGQVLGDNLKISRRPIGEPGRPVPYLPSELENKVGSHILPEWMDVVDDPTQGEWHGQILMGRYDYDMEGVAAKPLALIEKGVLKGFYLTRTPALKGFESSNGHALLRGSYGAEGASLGNMFVRATQTVSSADLKKKLIELCQQRGKPYGILIRKLDYPSSASVDELRRMSSAMAQSGGGTRPVVLPLLVYRVYPDGREELVRGLRFRGVSTRSFRDIIGATDETYVFNFLDSPAPFALMGAGGFVSNAAVVAPGVLFEEIELERSQDELPKLPIVPPPPLGS